ncbi:ICMT-domain-containing protein [Violaceomyces palustris]|uniref:ICMT-domain-containing protein n=1 Tax=Violaceomyces palustris TaxID=1673888 RepID=A0ACD0NST7_9BASI|nr:ICMT-domain-containing protein [Violaceomyces palustris]
MGLTLPNAFRFFLLLPTTSNDTLGEPFWKDPRLNLYLFSWSLFHLAEFFVTARYNPTRLLTDSFLLNNGVTYHVAHSFGLIEFILTSLLFPPPSQHWLFGSQALGIKPLHLSWIGLALILLGQFLRSLAMIQASDNFSHTIASTKRHDHRLVKEGVYSFSRHPSYFGFFYWALGTQILLVNPLSTLGFSLVLWKFFNSRIKHEEIHLVKFFGQEYLDYRRRVGTKLPFIP